MEKDIFVDKRTHEEKKRALMESIKLREKWEALIRGELSSEEEKEMRKRLVKFV